MKLSKMGMVLVLLVAVAGGLGLFFAVGKKPAGKTVSVVPTQVPGISPSQTPTVGPTNTTNTPSRYSAVFKAKVRSEFISDCNVRGHQSIAICTCTADYLAKNYSEAQLADFYIQFHASGQIPDAIKTVVGNCSGN